MRWDPGKGKFLKSSLGILSQSQDCQAEHQAGRAERVALMSVAAASPCSLWEGDIMGKTTLESRNLQRGLLGKREGALGD